MTALHKVFEASAGTGKTYTIVQEVLRLVTEGTPLDQILLVTFTEKAAGELKDRVRKGLVDAVEAAPEAAHLRAALDDFDKAPVFTIHGFCQRVLRQFPFANSAGTRAKMVRDEDIARPCLREVQRIDWQQSYKEHLPAMLSISRYSDREEGAEEWDNNVVQLLRDYKAECQHSMVPDGAEKFDAAALDRKTREALKIAADAFGPLTASRHPLIGDMEQKDYKLHSGTKKSVLRVIIPALLEGLKEFTGGADPVTVFQTMLTRSEKSSSFDRGFSVVLNYKGGTLPGLCRHFTAVMPRLDELRAEFEREQFRLASHTVGAVLEKMQAHKHERGLQSFDDLLHDVYRAVCGADARAEHMLEQLREKYRVAIVDEFQDTDPVQWSIFEKIFVQASGCRHSLMIVGDPKQAIYSFRSADVQTYLAARDALGKLGGTPQPLAISYRTSEELSSALNTVFETGGMFAGGSIAYSRVDAAKGKDASTLDVDRSGRKAVSMVQINAESSVLGRLEMARFIAAECARLLRDPMKMNIRGKTRALRASDIAVLIFRRNEADAIERALLNAEIPCSFYKKTGIWQSEEALQIWYVISALADTHDRSARRKMLLTRCFGVTPERLNAFEQLPVNDPLQKLIVDWQEMAENRRWPELFRSIVEDTGVLWGECKTQDSARRLANWRYISQTLARHACERGLGALELKELMRELRQLPAMDENNLQPLETALPAVQLMTVHASKGLEFPVVFLAGGFTGIPDRQKYRKYHDDHSRVIFDLTGSSVAKDRSRKEEDEEHRRQFYVAMTRAMFKLYVPLRPKPTKGRSVPGIIQSILAPVLQNVPENSPGIERIPSTGAPAPIEGSSAEAGADPAVSTLPEPSLEESRLSTLASRRLQIYSYSRLVHAHTPARDIHLDTIIKAPRKDDDDAEPRGKDDLPSCAASGDVLHQILENLDFSIVAKAFSPQSLIDNDSVRRLITENITRHLPDVAQSDSLLLNTAQMIWRVLRAPLKCLDKRRLCEVAASERSHEVEFHIPWWSALFDLAELTVKDGFLTGCMDLVMRVNGRYFLLDWKSNTLDAYTPEDVERDLKARRYDLQYRVYLQALKRWLGPAGVTEKNFGGVLYIYMRGVRENDPLSGVYFHKPTVKEWDEQQLIKDLRYQARVSGKQP